MTRHNEEGPVRQMRGRGRSRSRLYREFSIRAPLPRTGKQSAARLACGEPWLESEQASDIVHHTQKPAGTAITTGTRVVCPPTGAGAAITADTGAGVKYPSTGAGAQNTADAGAMYSSFGAGAEITAHAGAMAIMAGARAMCSSAGWRHDYGRSWSDVPVHWRWRSEHGCRQRDVFFHWSQSRLTRTRCARTLALAPGSRLTLAQHTHPQALALE